MLFTFASMLFSLFKTNTAPALASAFLLVCLIITPSWWEPIVFTSPALSSLPILKGLSEMPPWLNKLLGFVMVLSTAFYANFLSNKYGLLEKSSQMVFVFSAAFLVLAPSLQISQPLVASALLTVRFVDRCFLIQKSHSHHAIVFDAAFVLGLLTLIYPPNIFLLIALWVAMAYSGRARFKSYFLSIAVLGLVLYLSLGIGYLLNLRIVPLQFNWILKPIGMQHPIFWALAGIFSAELLFSFSSFFKALTANKVIIKNHYILLLIAALLLLLCYLGGVQDLAELFSALFFPFAVFLANFYTRSKSVWWLQILFYLFIVSVLAQQILGLYLNGN